MKIEEIKIGYSYLVDNKNVTRGYKGKVTVKDTNHAPYNLHCVCEDGYDAWFGLDSFVALVPETNKKEANTVKINQDMLIAALLLCQGLIGEVLLHCKDPIHLTQKEDIEETLKLLRQIDRTNG